MLHQLTKKLQHLKKKIKQFEEQFEKEKNYKVKTKQKQQQTRSEKNLCVIFKLVIAKNIINYGITTNFSECLVTLLKVSIPTKSQSTMSSNIEVKRV